MMAQVLTKFDQFTHELLREDKRAEILATLPAHVNPERFERNMINALMQNTALLDHDVRLVRREISKIAALGLYMDPDLGEAYIIVAYNGKTKRLEPQARIGYRGFIKLARQSGEIRQVYAHEVCANDEFRIEFGYPKRVVHRPCLDERGVVIGYYAVAVYRGLDGESESFDAEWMRLEEVHKIRDRSDAWKAHKAGKIKSTPWQTDEGEMAKKTTIRRLTKRLPLSPELQQAIKIEDEAEFPHMVNVTPAAGPKLVAPTPPVESSPDAGSEDGNDGGGEGESGGAPVAGGLRAPPPSSGKIMFDSKESAGQKARFFMALGAIEGIVELEDLEAEWLERFALMSPGDKLACEDAAKERLDALQGGDE